MKKGFTLIELLAVIVILAIIALIATPIVLNIINDSKESSLLRSAEFYLDAAEYTIADTFLNSSGLESKTYPITPEGDICKVALANNECSKENTLKVEVNGEKPSGGNIVIENGKIVWVSTNDSSQKTTLTIDGKTINYDTQKKELVIVTISPVCSPLVAGNLSTGAEVVCENEHFNILTNDGSTIQMLSSKNINVTGTGEVKQMDSAGTISYLKSTSCLDDSRCTCDYYWQDENGNLKDGYTKDSNNNIFTYSEENEMIYPYLTSYKNYLNNIGLEISNITLMSLEQALDITNYNDENQNGYLEMREITGPDWLYSTTFYLGTSSSTTYNYYIDTSYEIPGYTNSPSIYIDCAPNGSKNGVRPVITINANQIG